MNVSGTTIGKLVDGIAGRFGDRDALVFPERKLRLSWRQFREASRAVCRGLMALGVKRGDHVGAWAANEPEWVLLQFALGRMGAVLVTVNTQYRSSELEYILRQSDIRTLVLSEGFRDVHYPGTLYEVCPEARQGGAGHLHPEEFPRFRNAVVLGDKAYPGLVPWREMLRLGEQVPEEALEEMEEACAPDDLVVLMYTSGTTGFPKGVMLSHRNVVSNAAAVADCMKLSAADRLCIPVPFFHCFGCVMGTLACATCGAAMVPVSSFSAEAVLAAVHAERCTALHGVPTMFIAELEQLEKEPGRYDLSSLRTGIMAGSPCPVEVMKAVVERMRMREITIAYGLTEASPVITQTRVDDPVERRVATVGRPLPGAEVRVVDPVRRTDRPIGVEGELATRGPFVMKGYYKMPEATAQAVDAEGWLYTGDLAVMDDRGYFRITGRAKDTIIRGGENISPREIEEFLHTHPKVQDVQVVGVPSRRFGEEAAACVRLRPGQSAAPEELVAYCRRKIARFKVPRYVLFVDDYPKTASGKVMKHRLRDDAIARLGLAGS